MKHFSIFFERKLAAIAAFIATILRISGPDRDIFFIKEAFCLSLASNRDLFELEDASESLSVVAILFKLFCRFIALSPAPSRNKELLSVSLSPRSMCGDDCILLNAFVAIIGTD